MVVVSGMVPEPVKSWSRHFRNWMIISEEEEGERTRTTSLEMAVSLKHI